MNVFAFGLGVPEMMVIAIVGLLLYGRRLPEVGRTFGKTFFQFRRSMDDIRGEFYEAERMANDAARDAGRSYRDHEEEVIREAQAFQPRYGSDDDLVDDDPVASEGAPHPEDSDATKGADTKKPGDAK